MKKQTYYVVEKNDIIFDQSLYLLRLHLWWRHQPENNFFWKFGWYLSNHMKNLSSLSLPV